jgi:hypothetical protein
MLAGKEEDQERVELNGTPQLYCYMLMFLI